jgi:hypothetical protein
VEHGDTDGHLAAKVKWIVVSTETGPSGERKPTEFNFEDNFNETELK